MRLLDLFPRLTVTWPSRFSRDAAGFDVEGGDPEIPAFVAEINAALLLEDVVFGAADDTVAVEAKVRVQPTTGDHLPIVDADLPEITFKLLPTTGAFTHLRVAGSSNPPGKTILIDGLAVKIAFSVGTLMPALPPSGIPIPEVTVGDFVPGQLDSFAVTYRDSEQSEISVHIRVTVDAEGAVTVIPAVPIVLGPCRFLGVLPVQGIYDLAPILSPERARDTYEWLRHKIDDPPLMPVPTRIGMLGMRQLILDPNAEPLKKLWDRLNDAKSEKDPTAELVLEDLVIPQGLETWYLRHYQLGIRRNVVDHNDLREQYNFASAPVRLAFTSDPTIGVIVNYASLRSTDDDDDTEAEWPLTFEAGIFRGTSDSPRNAVSIGIEEQTTFLLSYLRSLDELGAGTELLDYKLFGFEISVAALRMGYSIAGEDRDFMDRAVLVGDFVVRDTQMSNKILRLEGLDGKPASFLIERLGWWFKNTLADALGGISLPDGLQIVLLDKFRIFIQEVALIGHTNGGHYIAISAGLAVPIGAAGVRRLRFKIGGNPDAPGWGLDGFYFAIKTDHVKADVGGTYIDERRGDAKVTELSLTGSIEINPGQVTYAGGVDFIWGNVEPDVGDSFWYLLFSGFVLGRVSFGIFTANSVRGLFAKDMRPKLDATDLASRELRYLAWNKRASPLSVGGDRRLAGWEANDKSWAVGFGLGLNFTGFAEACRLDSFALVLHDEGEDASVLFLSADVYLLNNLRKAIAFLAIEIDLDNLPNFSALLGVDIGPDQFVTDPPNWLQQIARITATIFISTDPGTFAIGRLDDPKTWATLRVRHEIFGTSGWFEVQLCFELSRDAEGFAFALRVGGKASICIFHFDFYIGLGFIIATFKTGSTVEAHCVWAEAGMQFRIWKWFRFSCKADIEVRGVGQDPSYGLASMRIRIETPWYLPDVTFKYSWTIGELTAEELSSMRGPLVSSGAYGEGTGASHAVHLTPFDGGDDRDRVRSIAELRAITPPPRATRVAAAFTGASAVPPIPTDVTVQLAFAVPVTDSANVGNPVPQLASDQKSGDLSLKLELIGMTIRRRERFDPAAPWTDLCQRVELPAILDGSGGATTGSFDPLPLTAFWEPVLVNGQTAAQRLLLNATTPFSYGTFDPNADDDLAEAEPGWPCCTIRDKQSWQMHELDFSAQPLGDPLAAAVKFPATRTTLHTVRSADVRVSVHAGGSLPAGTHAARWSARDTGTLFRVVADQPMAWLDLYLAWPSQVGGSVIITGLDEQGDSVAQVMLPLGTARPPTRQRLAATKPFVTLVCAARAGTTFGAPFVELTRASYVAYAELQAGLRRQFACKLVDHGAISGQGKIGFLPNHEYEIELRTRTTLSHPSTAAETAETTEFVYFRTKGLPGLNAVSEVGAEVRPHVASEYPGPNARLYREEPVVVAFDEKFNVVVPLASRPPRPASPERDVLLELDLSVRPTMARDPATPFTAAAPDWLTSHRTVVPPSHPTSWRDVFADTATVGRKDITTDPKRLRLAALIARPEACDLDNPLIAPSSVLVAQPPDDIDLGIKLWPSDAELIATISPKGGSDGPFVHRESFEPADLTALVVVDDSGPIGGGAWSVSDGVLAKLAPNRQIGVLGNEQWNHFTIDVAITVIGSAAGVAIALPHAASGATRGLFALIEREAGATFLALRRRTSAGGPLDQLARAQIDVSDGAIALAVTAFDDRISARVGETVLEAERDSLRDGCAGLVADGDAKFHTLSIGGLPMYRFAARTSRYRTFADHIASYEGRTGDVDPVAIGVTAPPPGAVANLFASTSSRIASVMTAQAEPAARDALFNEWIAALSLPLRSELSGIALTRYMLHGATRLLLLESPEPLPFSGDVKVTLASISGGGHWPPDWLDDLRDTILDMSDATVSLPRFTGRVRGPVALVHATVDGQGVHELRVYSGGLRPRRGGGAMLHARRTADIRVFDPAGIPALGTLRPGGIALVDLDLLDVIGEVYPVDPLPPPPLPPPTFSVLTDGSECRALLIPVRAGSAVTLDDGRWRLDFKLDRERWSETTPASPASRLTASGSIVFQLA
jgi:hypothetical protein